MGQNSKAIESVVSTGFDFNKLSDDLQTLGNGNLGERYDLCFEP